MDEPERQAKRRKLYKSPQPAGMYTASNQFPFGFEVQQGDQSCLRTLLKSSNQAELTEQTNNQDTISPERVGSYTLKRTITPEHTQSNKSYRNEGNNGTTVTLVMASGSRAPVAEGTTFHSPRMLPEDLNEQEEINPTSLGQALRKEFQKRAVAIQRVLSKHMFKVRSKMTQLERENKELRQFACSLDKTLQDALNQQKPKTAQMVSRETQVNMALENDLKVSCGTQVNMRVVFRPVLPNRKDVAIPRLLSLPSFRPDGSGKSKLVYLPASRETSGSSVSNEVDEITVSEHIHQDSNNKILPGHAVIENSSDPQAPTSPMERIQKRAISAYRNVSSRDSTSQNEILFSKSTDQANNHPRIEKVFSQATGLPTGEKTSSISSRCRVPFGSMITAQKDEWGSKPTEMVTHHTSIAKASSKTAKTLVAVKTSSLSAHCNPSSGSMASKETPTQKGEVLLSKSAKQVQNEVFHRSSYPVTTKSTTVPSVSEVGIERVNSARQLPKSSQKLPGTLSDKTYLTSNVSSSKNCARPDITSGGPEIREYEFCYRKDNVQNVPSGHSSSMKVLLTAHDPVRPTSDSGPFSIQRLLGSHMPSKEPQESDLNKHEYLSGVSSCSSSLKGEFVRDNDPVKPTSSHSPSSIEIFPSSKEPAQVTNTPSSLSSLQRCVQSSSSLSTSSSNTSFRNSTAGRHISPSLTATLNGSLEQEKSGIHPAPPQTTSSNISQALYNHNKPRQNPASSNKSSAETIGTNTSIRQNPGNAHKSKSQIHFHSSVLKLSRDKTPQKGKLPVATVKAMTSYSNSLHVSSSVPSPKRLNRRSSTEGTRNRKQWRHIYPKIQTEQKEYDVEALHFPESPSSLFTPSQNSDLQTFVNYLTDPETPNAGSVIKEQTFKASFDIGQESLLEGHLTYYDSLQAQQVEIFQNQSRRVWTLQPGDNRKSVDHSIPGMYNKPDSYSSAIEEELLPSYNDNMMPSQSYFSNCHSPADTQYTTNGFQPSGVQSSPQSRLHLEHCPMRQAEQHKNQQYHLHHRRRIERLPYKQR